MHCKERTPCASIYAWHVARVFSHVPLACVCVPRASRRVAAEGAAFAATSVLHLRRPDCSAGRPRRRCWAGHWHPQCCQAVRHASTCHELALSKHLRSRCGNVPRVRHQKSPGGVRGDARSMRFAAPMAALTLRCAVSARGRRRRHHPRRKSLRCQRRAWTP